MFSSEALVARTLWVGLGIAAAAAGAHYVGVKGAERSAFNRWRPQLRALANGEDIYATHAFPTPPIMAALLLPLAKLPPAAGMTLWFAAKAAFAVVAAVWLSRTFVSEGPAPWVAPAGLALCSAPILGDLQHGNVNLWILILLAAAWGLHRRGHDFSAGLATALAAACKVTPALLAAYFLWRGRGRAVVGALVGAVLWLFVAPGFVFGHARNLDLLQSWGSTMLKPFVERGEVEENEVNQSLPALATRLLAPATRHPWEKKPPIQANFVQWSPVAVRAAATAASGAALLLWLALTRRGLPDVGFCLTLLAMLAVSERSWKHHYVTALPSFLLLLAAARRRRAFWWPALAASMLLLACSKDAVGAALSDGLQARGAYLWAAGLLAAALWRLGRAATAWQR